MNITWISFGELKPEIGQEIIVKYPSGTKVVGTYGGKGTFTDKIGGDAKWVPFPTIED